MGSARSFAEAALQQLVFSGSSLSRGFPSLSLSPPCRVLALALEVNRPSLNFFFLPHSRLYTSLFHGRLNIYIYYAILLYPSLAAAAAASLLFLFSRPPLLLIYPHARGEFLRRRHYVVRSKAREIARGGSFFC